LPYAARLRKRLRRAWYPSAEALAKAEASPVVCTLCSLTKYKGKVKTPGICALLGLRPFTPHDLRRRAGDLGFDDAWIAKCLDHAASKKQEQIVPSVTGKVSNHSKRMKEKRGAGRRRSGASADHRRARRNRTASRRLTLGMAMSPLSSKADIATALQHGKRNVSRAARP
jgi:hypothetical protein